VHHEEWIEVMDVSDGGRVVAVQQQAA